MHIGTLLEEHKRSDMRMKKVAMLRSLCMLAVYIRVGRDAWLLSFHGAPPSKSRESYAAWDTVRALLNSTRIDSCFSPSPVMQETFRSQLKVERTAHFSTITSKTVLARLATCHVLAHHKLLCQSEEHPPHAPPRPRHLTATTLPLLTSALPAERRCSRCHSRCGGQRASQLPGACRLPAHHLDLLQ